MSTKNIKTEFLKNNPSKIEIMKINKILIIALVVISNTIFAQSVFDKFDNQDDITTVVVNKKMFSMLSKVDAKDKASQQYLNLIKKLDNLKVFVTSSDKKSDDMKAVADKYIKTAG